MNGFEDRGHHEDRDDEIFEARMAQYEDRIDKRKKSRIAISELLHGRSKKKWVEKYGTENK